MRKLWFFMAMGALVGWAMAGDDGGVFEKWWNGAGATGDWFGARERMEDRGVILSGRWGGTVIGVVGGGLQRGWTFEEELTFGAKLSEVAHAEEELGELADEVTRLSNSLSWAKSAVASLSGDEYADERAGYEAQRDAFQAQLDVATAAKTSKQAEITALNSELSPLKTDSSNKRTNYESARNQVFSYYGNGIDDLNSVLQGN